MEDVLTSNHRLRPKLTEVERLGVDQNYLLVLQVSDTGVLAKSTLSRVKFKYRVLTRVGQKGKTHLKAEVEFNDEKTAREYFLKYHDTRLLAAEYDEYLDSQKEVWEL